MFIGFLPIEDRRRNPTYWAICRGIASSSTVLDLAELVRPPQFPQNVVFAAVHDVLLAGADHELARHYRSVASLRGIEYQPIGDRQLAELFISLCRTHYEELASRCATRSTQTNEVGRCAAIRAALCSLGADGPVALLDVGCSAGLNLFVDAYGYEYGQVRAGDGRAAPVLHCELAGVLPPLELPKIASRVGLDQSPIDPSDPIEVRWLLACLWPDDVGRFERFRSAVDVAVSRRDEVTFVRGDMVDSLAAAAERSDPDAHLVLFDTWSTAYLPPPRREEFARAVEQLASGRDLTWVTMEFPTVARDLGVLPDGVEHHHRGASVVCVTRYARGARTSSLVGEVHHHGRWLDWYSEALGVT
jgi:hypothetical protein